MRRCKRHLLYCIKSSIRAIIWSLWSLKNDELIPHCVFQNDIKCPKIVFLMSRAGASRLRTHRNRKVVHLITSLLAILPSPLPPVVAAALAPAPPPPLCSVSGSKPPLRQRSRTAAGGPYDLSSTFFIVRFLCFFYGTFLPRRYMGQYRVLTQCKPTETPSTSLFADRLL